MILRDLTIFQKAPFSLLSVMWGCGLRTHTAYKKYVDGEEDPPRTHAILANLLPLFLGTERKKSLFQTNVLTDRRLAIKTDETRRRRPSNAKCTRSGWI